ncbi:hypothetical protein BVRB_033910, partial [Beta vulgaris subsp. vulgaris]
LRAKAANSSKSVNPASWKHHWKAAPSSLPTFDLLAALSFLQAYAALLDALAIYKVLDQYGDAKDDA